MKYREMASFSLLNTILTPLRNQLLVENVANLMFVNLNGQPLKLGLLTGMQCPT